MRRAAARALSSAPLPAGFMAAARERGAAALLGPLAVGALRYDASLAGLVVTAVAPGAVSATLRVTERLTNAYGTLHGGATATLVDVMGTLAALSLDAARPGVSVNMTQAFLRAARGGDELFLAGRCVKHGARLAFTEVELRVGAADGPLVATGTHTKAL